MPVATAPQLLCSGVTTTSGIAPLQLLLDCQDEKRNDALFHIDKDTQMIIRTDPVIC